MKSRANIVICFAAALLLAGCGAEPTALPAATTAPAIAPTSAPAAETPTPGQSTDSGTLPGTNWSLTSLGGQSPVKGTSATLNFGTNGKASGNDGCNSYTTTYTSDATTIKIEAPAAATLMACATPIMGQATAFSKALGQAATYKIERQQLTLSGPVGKELAVFAAQSSDLAGTNWNVTGYNNGKQAVVSVMNGTTITANFGKVGNLSGSAGCNEYSTTYTTDSTAGKDTIQFGPISATKKACAVPQGLMEQEGAYLAALSTVATYKIDGNKMEMQAADGSTAVTLQKAPATGGVQNQK